MCESILVQNALPEYRKPNVAKNNANFQIPFSKQALE